jgi:preprotein translocase subunit SecA
MAHQAVARQFLMNCVAGVDNKGRTFIRGTYLLALNCGHLLDEFRLRVTYPDEFPDRNAHPNVYLESHRDKWVPGGNSHIETSWRLCLFVAFDSGLNFEEPGELEHLFPHIHTFLLRERVYQRDRKLSGDEATWPGPDRAHGAAGLLEAISAAGAKIGRNDPCVCGSGKKFKKCCQQRISQLASQRRRRNHHDSPTINEITIR